jgi:hypothetical protein
MSYVLFVQSVALLFSWGNIAAHLPPRPPVTLPPVVVLPQPMIVPQTLPPSLPRVYGGGRPHGGSFGNG